MLTSLGTNLGTSAPVTTEADYWEAIALVVDRARYELRILDADLQRTGLLAPAGARSIGHFLQRDPKARIRIALHSGHATLPEAPHLLASIRHKRHQLELRAVPDTLPQLADCHVLGDALSGIRRFHKDFPRGTLVLDDPTELAPWWHRFDELWALSEPINWGITIGL